MPRSSSADHCHRGYILATTPPPPPPTGPTCSRSPCFHPALFIRPQGISGDERKTIAALSVGGLIALPFVTTLFSEHFDQILLWGFHLHGMVDEGRRLGVAGHGRRHGDSRAYGPAWVEYFDVTAVVGTRSESLTA